MSKVMSIVTALLLAGAPLVAPLAAAGEAARASGDVPQIVAFDNENFLGDHFPIFGDMRDLGKWGNSISSLVIPSDSWEFFDDENFTGTSMGTLGPGMYANVAGKGMKNNSISSVWLAKPAGASGPDASPPGGRAAPGGRKERV